MRERPIFGMRLKVWIISPGKKKRLVRNRWSRSFVQQWIDVLYSHFRNTVTGFNVKRVNGTSAGNYYAHTIDTNTSGYYNSDLFGIVVGSGGNGVDVSDYRLQSQIMHGGSIGQLFHSKCLAANPTLQETGRKRVEFNRIFSNQTSLDIVVREIGMYARETQNNVYYCFVRDDVGAIIVPSGGGIAINYGVELSL